MRRLGSLSVLLVDARFKAEITPDRDAVGSEHPSKRKQDKRVVSGHCPFLPGRWFGRGCALGGADAYPNGLHPVLLLRANDLGFRATYLRATAR